MKLSFADERLLAVMAHPDDAELLCAGTLARAKADGASIGIAVMCAGDKGAGSATTATGDQLARLRREEAAAAANVIGAELFWLGGLDGELFDTTETRRGLMDVYRHFRPTLVIAHAPEDYHPDHRASSQVAEAASWFAGSRGHITETAAPPLDAPPKLWFADTINMSCFSPHFFVSVGDQL